MQSPSAIQQYNEELALAHREAIAALRELLAAEKDPTERRRLAIAMLKARPIKDPAAQPEAKAVRPASKRRIETLAELEAITAILETDAGDLKRLFSAYSPQPAPAQSLGQPIAEPPPPNHQAAA